MYWSSSQSDSTQTHDHDTAWDLVDCGEGRTSIGITLVQGMALCDGPVRRFERYAVYHVARAIECDVE